MSVPPPSSPAPDDPGAGPWPDLDVDLESASMQSVLQRVATLAKDTVPGADEVSVTLVERGRAMSAAWTGLLAFELDEAQFGLEHGPCLHSATSGGIVRIDDMRAEERWPHFTPLAVRQGALASLSTPIPFPSSLQAALNCYSSEPGGFTQEAQRSAAALVTRVAGAIHDVHVFDRTRRTVTELQQAMRSRAVIEQATGIVMARSGLGSGPAFDALARRSQETDRTHRDVAADLVAEVTGERDDGGGAR